MRLFADRDDGTDRRLARETWRMLRWQVDHARLRQHGFELPAEAEPCWTGRFEVVKVSLRSLFRRWKGTLVPLEDTMLVRYLKSGDVAVLDDYERMHVDGGLISMEGCKAWREKTEETFSRLRKEPYNPSVSCLVIDAESAIVDGYHRSAALFARYGGDHEIAAIRIVK